MIVHTANAIKIKITIVKYTGNGSTPITQVTIKNATNNPVQTLFKIKPIFIF